MTRREHAAIQMLTDHLLGAGTFHIDTFIESRACGRVQSRSDRTQEYRVCVDDEGDCGCGDHDQGGNRCAHIIGMFLYMIHLGNWSLPVD